jgi:tRNA(adenine34) deaminase
MVDLEFMHIALEEAKKAYKEDEVPVGAVVVYNNKVVSKAHNKTVSLSDPAGHAEILALRKACKKFNNYRLPPGTTLYVTLEPCMMCLGAILWCRVETLVYGADESKFGAVRRYLHNDILRVENYPKVKVIRGLLETDIASLMKQFFSMHRD